MLRYLEAIEQLPGEIKLPLMRVLELFREEVIDTVRKSDFEELKGIVKELAEAQRRTEQRVEELAEAQRETQKEVSRLDKALQELAEAQRRTEEELRKLIKEHNRTREMLGGISDAVGYGLEDKIMPYIPDFVHKEFGIETVLIDRRNIVYPDGRYDEVNVYVEGRKDGEKVYLIGECKARPSKKDIDRFITRLKRIKNHLNAPLYFFIAGYTYSPEVEKYVKEKYPEIKLMKSFQFEMKYGKK